MIYQNKNTRPKIITSLVIKNSIPTKVKENKGKIKNCSKGEYKNIFDLIFEHKKINLIKSSYKLKNFREERGSNPQHLARQANTPPLSYLLLKN
jgi:hypothetical protein